MPLDTMLLIAACFALGGIVKGMTGAGAPIVAIPIIAGIYDVPFAVTLFAIPNLIPNIWQGWRYRAHRLPGSFVWVFALAGALGVGIGTFLLVNLPSRILQLMVAVAVLFYIAFRLRNAHWTLSRRVAGKLALPLGALAGALQGASGISAPISITFLSAMRLERAQFVFAIAVFFASVAIVQIPLLALFGFMTTERLVLSFAALIPLMGAMPVGAWLVQHVSRNVFDKIILGLLGMLAIKLIANAVV